MAVVTLIIDMLISQEPRLEPMRAELLLVFTGIGVMLMGTIAAEDVSLNNMVGKVEAGPGTVITQTSAPVTPSGAAPLPIPILNYADMPTQQLHNMIADASKEISKRLNPPEINVPLG